MLDRDRRPSDVTKRISVKAMERQGRWFGLLTKGDVEDKQLRYPHLLFV